MPFCFQVQFQTLWDDWPLWNCSFLAVGWLMTWWSSEMIGCRFFLYTGSWSSDIQLTGVYCYIAPKNCKLPYTKEYLSVKCCSYFFGPSCFILSICGMRLQGNRFSGRVPKSVGVPRGPIIQQCTQNPSIAKWKCGNISFELVLQHSNHQFPSKKKTVIYSDLRTTCCLDFWLVSKLAFVSGSTLKCTSKYQAMKIQEWCWWFAAEIYVYIFSTWDVTRI